MKRRDSSQSEGLSLQTGAWVEVWSQEEILAKSQSGHTTLAQ
jgi:hypothetical protein